MAEDKTKRLGRWYFGGVAGAMAACCTHPLDLLKVSTKSLLTELKHLFQVQLQTQQQGKLTIGQLSLKIYKNDGILAFYNGVSASVLRQLTYSTTRFGIYETVKKQLPQDQPLPFYQKALLAGFAGACGGLIGTPGDLVNVRMQNDSKLPLDQRRNYKHALDGLIRITKDEGFMKMFNGVFKFQ